VLLHAFALNMATQVRNLPFMSADTAQPSPQNRTISDSTQRYFMRIAYDGQSFQGWQKNPKRTTVQQTIEGAFEKVLQKETLVIGSGRTDTGVHASGQVAHIDLPLAINLPYMAAEGLKPDQPNLDNLLYRINRVLPATITILNMEPVAQDMHARFSAKRRTYRFLITSLKQPFISGRMAFMPALFPSDILLDSLNETAALLLGKHDFSALSKYVDPTQQPHGRCHIHTAQWHYLSQTHTEAFPFISQGPILVFEICANRFLRGMVRALVSAQLEVARDRQPLSWLSTQLDLGATLMGQPTALPFNLAPPEGLYLTQVSY
jgi:tRNA pseudouridine38-40 synthase